jgi:hypothetical protein
LYNNRLKNRAEKQTRNSTEPEQRMHDKRHYKELEKPDI